MHALHRFAVLHGPQGRHHGARGDIIGTRTHRRRHGCRKDNCIDKRTKGIRRQDVWANDHGSRWKGEVGRWRRILGPCRLPQLKLLAGQGTEWGRRLTQQSVDNHSALRAQVRIQTALNSLARLCSVVAITADSDVLHLHLPPTPVRSRARPFPTFLFFFSIFVSF